MVGVRRNVPASSVGQTTQMRFDHICWIGQMTQLVGQVIQVV